ncbi:glycosyltransferase [Amylibacter sp.]|nr:glycosyltransferase [Amylibacter sp.]
MKILSICIPAFNRPKKLERLLNSIDINPALVEIVIAEDFSQKRNEIIEVVKKFQSQTQYEVKLYLNNENIGYDRNIRKLVNLAQSKYIIFMGDDDTFVEAALDKLADFLNEHPLLGYVLKRHVLLKSDGSNEPFRYYKTTKFFEPGEQSYTELFRKSVFISGFTINRQACVSHLNDTFDGTLLQQLYLLAEVVMQHPSAYFDEPLTVGYDDGVPEFGTSETEKALYTPGKPTVDNSITFLSGYIKIAKFIDMKYDLALTHKIIRDLSNYSFPSLSVHRDKGYLEFVRYARRMQKLGFHGKYFYVYIIVLALLGVRIPASLIVLIKKIYGRTPQLT